MRKELNLPCRTNTHGELLWLVDTIMFNYFQNILDLMKKSLNTIFFSLSVQILILVQMTQNVHYLSQTLPKAASV